MQEKRFSTELMYDEYMSYIFACVNYRLSDYIEGLMKKYDAGQGNYKNVMYPDIEIAHDLCSDSIQKFFYGEDKDDNFEELLDVFDDELKGILEHFGTGEDELEEEERTDDKEEKLTVEKMFAFIDARLAVTDTSKINIPFYELCRKLELGHFTIFALAAAILSSTRTSYAAVFQVVNENGSLVAPTVFHCFFLTYFALVILASLLILGQNKPLLP